MILATQLPRSLAPHEALCRPLQADARIPEPSLIHQVSTHPMSLFDVLKHSGAPIPTTDAERNELVVTEGSTGYWHYHLSRRASIMRGLCGAPTLPTAIPVSAWGAKEEGLPKPPKYCEKCAALAWPPSGAAESR